MDASQNESAAMPANGGTSGALREATLARTSRRNMLRRGGVAAAATVAGLTLLDQRRAEAATGDPFTLGQANNANATTSLAITAAATLVPLFHVSAAGLSGSSTTMIVDGPGSVAGLALQVNGNSGGTGIKTSAATGPSGTVGLALAAAGTNGANAIDASSDKGIGVAASSTTGPGVTGASHSNAGVAGSSATGSGVTGKGRVGGIFNGSVADLRLIPQAGAHPAHGTKGDLFVDQNVHLWFCRGGAVWVRLA
jgi:hypothetical protein